MYSNRLNWDFNYKNMKTAMRNYLKYTLLTRALLLSLATAATINVLADYSTIRAALPEQPLWSTAG